ncbi:MAG: PD40 domain-containing protein [Phycisphaerales bacterium]|nr:MAG: PD40 domain-containing protein [Phycisphaerales bacterium]
MWCNRTTWGMILVGLAFAGDGLAVNEGLRGDGRGRDILVNSMGQHEQIIFACRQEGHDGHWYANFGYYAANSQRKAYRALGRLCKLNVRTGRVEVLLDDPEGTVRDPQVHYDGRKILFSYRKGGADYFHLYEINPDGSGLQQLTDGPYNDIEPTYLADGGIMFCSDRCKRWVNCWLTKVAVLYRCGADGSDIRPISSNNEHENTPWPLPDGRVLYQRWEYVDRSQVHYHHLWTINPDGTGQMVFYGNMHPGTVMIDAKPIPGTGNVVAIFSPGHGRREHAGAVTILSPKRGPDELSAAVRVSNGDDFRDPYPLSKDHFLVAQGPRLVLMDAKGNVLPIYRLPESLVKAGVTCHEPRPLRPRMRERLVARRGALQETTGKLILTDIYNGRQMGGVERGEIKKLLVLESLPMPIHYTGGMDPISFGGTFTLERVLGTVPVEPDGSAYMEVPALRSLFFVALDADDNSVKRMQSFLTVMPGETASCVGCHEHRTRTPENRGASALSALQRVPSEIMPIDGIPDVFDFPRDIQPILDKHCIRCHDYEKRDGNVILSGDRGPMFSHSYYTLTYRREFVDGRNDPKSNLPPRTVGAAASPLMEKIAGDHYDVRLSQDEVKMIRYWIESGAPYPGTYAALGSGMIGGYYENRQVNTDFEWPATRLASEAIETRCTSCHAGDTVLPRNLSDERGVSFWRPDPGDVRLRLARHLVFNLTRPEKSLMLLAPLAKDAGGYGRCKVTNNRSQPSESAAVFASTDDPDYQKILVMCRDGKRRLEEMRRFDMSGFVPPAAYVREMKKYGVLPGDLPDGTAIDVYETDRKYWRSLWHNPDDNSFLD